MNNPMMHGWLLTQRAILSAIALMIGGGSIRSQSNDGQLFLNELTTVRIPTEMILKGARLGSDSGLVFWSEGFVMFVDRDVRSRVCPSEVRDPIAAAFVEWQGRMRIEVVTSGGRMIADTNPRAFADCVVETQLKLGTALVAATHLGSDWLVIATDGDQARHLFRVDSLFTPHKLDSAGKWPADGNSEVHLSPSRQGAILTAYRWPFEWKVLGPTGTVLMSSAPTESMNQEDASSLPVIPLASETERWLSLQTLEIASGYVQTLADPRGDARMIIRYNESGRVINVTPMQLPFGFLASNVEAGIILALRTTDQQELVTYGWRSGADRYQGGAR